MSKILRHRTADGRVRRLLLPTQGAVTTDAKLATEWLATQRGGAAAPAEWRGSPSPIVTKILRRRSADGRVRRILLSSAASQVPVSVTAPVAIEWLAQQSGDKGALLEWLALELPSNPIPVEWLEQAIEFVGDEVLSIEWSALPAPLRVSLERLLASPGKRRILSTPGRLRLLKRL